MKTPKKVCCSQAVFTAVHSLMGSYSSAASHAARDRQTRAGLQNVSLALTQMLCSNERPVAAPQHNNSSVH